MRWYACSRVLRLGGVHPCADRVSSLCSSEEVPLGRTIKAPRIGILMTIAGCTQKISRSGKLGNGEDPSACLSFVTVLHALLTHDLFVHHDCSAPVYAVEFASAKRIRLSLNFQDDDIAPPKLKAIELASAHDPVKKEEVVDRDQQQPEPTLLLDAVPHVQELDLPKVVEAPMVDDVKMKEEGEKQSSPVPSGSPVKVVVPAETPAVVTPATQLSTSRKMDISMLCAAASPQSDGGDGKDEKGESLRSNGDATPAPELPPVERVQSEVAAEPAPLAPQPEPVAQQPPSSIATILDAPLHKDKPVHPDGEVKTELAVIADTPTVDVTEPQAGTATDSTPTSVTSNHMLPRVGSKKRMIIDDDSTNSSSDSETENSTAQRRRESERVKKEVSPAKKRRKVSLSDEPDKILAPPSPESRQLSKGANDASAVKEGGASPVRDALEPEMTKLADHPIASNGSLVNDDPPRDKTSGDNHADPVPKSSSVSDTFDVMCASCNKAYDMRYLDPPLVDRPIGEWRCFECLVNDARGWPRRRKKSVSRDEDERAGHSRADKKEKKSSSKSRTSSSSTKKSRSKSGNSSQGERSRSSKSKSGSSKRKKSSSSQSTSKKTSTSSTSKRHKKRKTSTSSSHHHSSSSSHHKSRRHHHHHQQHFSKLADMLRARQRQRQEIEDDRIHGGVLSDVLDGPTGWRVASSTLPELKQLIESLTGGSLEQDRYCNCFTRWCQL